MILYHLHQIDDAGQVLYNLLGHYQLEPMMATPMLNADYNTLEHLVTDEWLKQVGSLLHGACGNTRGDFWVPPLQKKGDKHLVDLFVDFGLIG